MSEELSDATTNEMEIQKEDEEDSFWDAFDNDLLLNSEKTEETTETTNESSESSEKTQSMDMLSAVQERVSQLKKHFSYITDRLKQMLQEQQDDKLRSSEMVEKYCGVKYTESGGDIASTLLSDQSVESEEPDLQFIVERIGDTVACQTIENDPCFD
ncbi:hypothetical protein KR215_005577 [Drosophila sulfurigaster]|nr:hypothetical protein KR215_005577 [Drosophila sulfurigaster]